jgi:hypothetical protein
VTRLWSIVSQWEASREERTVKKSERKDFGKKEDAGNIYLATGNRNDARTIRRMRKRKKNKF